MVEELADGLEQTYRRYLGQGLAPQAAAEATVAEFGAAELIAAEFSRAPGPPGGPQAAGGRSSGGLLLGPGAGDWSCLDLAVPVTAGIVPGLTLAAVIILLARRRAQHPVPVCRRRGSGRLHRHRHAGMIPGVLAADPAIRQAAVIAVAASTARIGYSARLLRPVLTRQ